METHQEFFGKITFPLLMVCTDVHAASCDLRPQKSSYGTQVVSPLIGIEVKVGYFDIDELLDAPGGLIIFLVDRLYTFHGVTSEGDRDKEIGHMNKVIRKCSYPDWALTSAAS